MERDLGDWLRWQETLHPAGIELGLERVRAVADTLLPGQGSVRPGRSVISVAGTNGKGSSVAMLEAIYRAAGYRTAAYSSPHLSCYNERLRLDGRPVADADLCAAFERVEEARGRVRLTYFEFGTLAILDLMGRWMPDVALLEVGLGGRLDAVNIAEPDLALITNVGLDHQQWLGDSRDAIAAEKAGIMRASAAAVFGQVAVPASIRERARHLGVRLHSPGESGYRWRMTADGWEFRSGRRMRRLPLPALGGRHQLVNAAAVLQAVELLQARLPASGVAIAEGLRGVCLAGRMERIDGPVEVLLDVAHNPDGAEALAAHLADQPPAGRTRAVIGVLADKDLAGILSPLLRSIDGWYCAGLADAPRGLAGDALAGEVGGLSAAPVRAYGDPVAALQAAIAASEAGDRVVVFGSFLTVAAVRAVALNQGA